MSSMTDTITSANAFPRGQYTPHGYLDNPAHSLVRNRSGIVRSVPPLGFGFWCRPLPWGYTSGVLRDVNYLSLLHISLQVDDLVIQTADDLSELGIDLYSAYHTSRIFTYDLIVNGVRFALEYILADEHVLLCTVTCDNTGATPRTVRVFATNIYGYVAQRWWGSDGFCTNMNQRGDALVSKIWAYGDVCVVHAGAPAEALYAHTAPAAWSAALRTGAGRTARQVHCAASEAVYATRQHALTLAGGATQTLTLCLARGVNEDAAQAAGAAALANAAAHRAARRADDQAFYAQMPLLAGDWPAAWKEGWLHDFETLRMTVRPPCGIFSGRWDGMQIFSPRCVLGETALDMVTLSFADAACAKEVLRTTMCDTPGPHVPCCREDGSMNMIGTDGSECGTSPVWGLPFKVIMSLYQRAPDDEWLRAIYPRMVAFVEWWCEHRTDAKGWFFCRNSWESGQDGSRRFKIDAASHEGDPADVVRTVDVEAAMAHAMQTLAQCAEILGEQAAAQHWRARAEEHVRRTRSMFFDGWFRDVDGRTDTPIILEDYCDVMMLLPVTLGIATPEQTAACAQRLAYFCSHPGHWLEWPSFMMFFADAAWNAGQRALIAETIAATADRVYSRTTARTVMPAGEHVPQLPAPYHYRIPGVACEFWPVHDARGGCENYGWGATLPLHIISSIIGFRVDEAGRCLIAPNLPAALRSPGRVYHITHLCWRNLTFDLTLSCGDDGALATLLAWRAPKPCVVSIKGADGRTLATSARASRGTFNTAEPVFECVVH